MKKLVFGALLFGGLALSGAASATVFLDSGSFGSSGGVHSTPGLSSTLVTGLIHGTDLVTFTSDDTLTTSGGGESDYDGPFDDLLISFDKSYGAITFAIKTVHKVDSDMTLVVGGNTFTRTLTKELNKFTLHGDAGETFDTLDFTFDPSVADIRQVRVLPAAPPGGGIPEPATWAMLIMGFGGMGAVLRHRRRQAGAAFA